MSRQAAALKEEWHNFLKSTSMRGVSRVTATQSTRHQVYWGAIIASLLALALYNCGLIVQHYITYPVILSVMEEVLSHEQPPPIALVCDSRAFAPRHTWPEGVLTPSEYYTLVDDVFGCPSDGCSPEEEDTRRKVREKLQTPFGFLQYVGPQQARRFGRKQEDFIADCYGYVYRSNLVFLVPCEQVLDIEEVFYSDVYTCMQLKPKPSNAWQDTRDCLIGATFSIYFDTDTSGSAQVWMTAHAYPNSTTDLKTYAILSAGQHLEMTVDLTDRKKLGPPYTDCDGELQEGITRCALRKTTDYLFEMCGCQLPLQIVEGHQSNANFCWDLSLPADELLQNFLCTQDILYGNLSNGVPTCKPPCRETRYSVNRDTMSLTFNHLSSLYEGSIKGKPYEARFADFLHIGNDNCSSDPECERKLRNAEVKIRANFAQVSYHFSSETYYILEDVVQVSGNDVFSQLGAVLNFWSGITFVVFMELGEMVWRLAQRLLACKLLPSRRQVDAEQG